MAGLGAVVAVLLLASCSAGPTPEDEAFLSALGEPVDSERADGLIAAGRDVCDRLAAVTSLDEFGEAQLAIGAANGRQGDDLLRFENAAVGAYCFAEIGRLRPIFERDAAAQAAETQRQVDEYMATQPPGPDLDLNTPGTQEGSAPAEECIGYGCSPEQDAQLNEEESEANAGERGGGGGAVDEIEEQGRPLTSGEEQYRYACEQGDIPPEQC